MPEKSEPSFCISRGAKCRGGQQFFFRADFCPTTRRLRGKKSNSFSFPTFYDRKSCNCQLLTESSKNEPVVDSVEEEEGMGERDKMLLEQLRDDLQSRLRS